MSVSGNGRSVGFTGCVRAEVGGNVVVGCSLIVSEGSCSVEA